MSYLVFVCKQFTVLAYLPHAQGRVHLGWEPPLTREPVHLLPPLCYLSYNSDRFTQTFCRTSDMPIHYGKHSSNERTAQSVAPSYASNQQPVFKCFLNQHKL